MHPDILLQSFIIDQFNTRGSPLHISCVFLFRGLPDLFGDNERQVVIAEREAVLSSVGRRSVRLSVRLSVVRSSV